MKFRRYAVTVMDNWTPRREFWRLKSARRFAARYQCAFVFKWNPNFSAWHVI